MGFDEGDSGESAGEVTEQLGLHTWSRISGTSETEIKTRFYTSPRPLVSIREHGGADHMTTCNAIVLSQPAVRLCHMPRNGKSIHSKQCSDRRSPSTLLALHATIEQKLYTFPSFAQLMVHIENDNVYKPTNHVNNAQYKKMCV